MEVKIIIQTHGQNETTFNGYVSDIKHTSYLSIDNVQYIHTVYWCKNITTLKKLDGSVDGQEIVIGSIIEIDSNNPIAAIDKIFVLSVLI